MNYKEVLRQLQEGSRAQRKRKEELDKKKKALLTEKKQNEENIQETIDAQIRYCSKIREGNKNSLRTINIRLFFLLFQNKEVYSRLREVKHLMKRFDSWLTTYEEAIQKKVWKAEDQKNKAINTIMKEYMQKRQDIENTIANEQSIKYKSHLTLGLIMLTATILLFKETKEVLYKIEIFDENNRENPLNPFYPFYSFESLNIFALSRKIS